MVIVVVEGVGDGGDKGEEGARVEEDGRKSKGRDSSIRKYGGMTVEENEGREEKGRRIDRKRRLWLDLFSLLTSGAHPLQAAESNLWHYFDLWLPILHGHLGLIHMFI
ncbi:hypothetical protein ACH5RR_015722 [Cinchona calisaya]|uniref:Uncharacterized protein n=1 Tax=Cinchona calisaya TaxID=153742 RepID=A0ABD2ZZC3_9GENT